MDEILWNTEQKKVTILVCNDLSAAFGMVDHSVLIKVLNKYYGIFGSALQWFESYLADRCMKVIIGEFNSVMELGCHLDTVCSWMDSNRLKMNAKTTEVIYIGSRNQLDKCESKKFCVRNDLIPRSPVIKYLGVWINELLTFQCHINMTCKTAIWTLMKIQYLRQYLDQAICEILIYSLVMSHLYYANIILFGATNKVISRLQRVQNWVAKVILIKSKYDSSFEARKTLHRIPIWERIEFKLLVMVYNCLKGDAPIYLRKLLKINIGYGSLRSNALMKLTIPYVKLRHLQTRHSLLLDLDYGIVYLTILEILMT